MSKPVAVLISDVHYSLSTLALADAAMRQAVAMANELRVTLVVAGDLHDTKANMRGECIAAMIETFKMCHSPAAILAGNHDMINEKSESHSLEFLRAYAAIIDYLPQSALHKIGYLVPYQHDLEALRAYLKGLPKGSRLIMHQGLANTNSGHYIQDKTALNHEDVQDFRIISGHYHTRQTIKTGPNGTWDYIGNPYTLNYAEANDPPKGFQVLMDDGSLKFVPTYLRKHHVIERQAADLGAGGHVRHETVDDLFWVKVHGSKEELLNINKEIVARAVGVMNSFRLDLIPTETTTKAPAKQLTGDALLDSLIDGLTNTSDERKLRLKDAWKILI